MSPVGLQGSDQRLVRVLMLIDSLRPGGAERFTAALATHLPRDRYEVCVCATREASGILATDLTGAGIRHFALGRRGRYDVLPFRRLAAFMREQRIDILHAHQFGSNLWGSLLARASRVPVMIAQEHGWSFEGRGRRFLDRWVIGRLASAFVAGTVADRERIVSLEGVPDEKVVAIPAAYVPRVELAQADLRRELGIGPDAPVVGTVALLRPEKAIEVLIDAFAQLSRSRPGAHLVVVGDGPCRPELERIAEGAGVDGRVHFLGMREDVGTVLKAVDVAALSSDHESTSMFALECIAHDTPLVSTAVGGPNEILTDGESALLVPPRNPAALADAIGTLLDDRDRGRQLAEAARRGFDEFTIGRIAARHAELYERLLRGEPAVAPH